MPILLPNNHPSLKSLQEKNIFIMNKQEGQTQDIRPLKIAILNLMPKKEDTENQLLRIIGGGPLQIDPVFISLNSYIPKNICISHLESFYKPFNTVKEQTFDGLIVTGAPVEHLPFKKVEYWDELKEILDWAKNSVTSSLFLCWGAQAALQHYYGINKYDIEMKHFGIFKFSHTHTSNLLKGLDDEISIPFSQNAKTKKSDLINNKLKILINSERHGVAIACNENETQIFSFGHLEYDRSTLANEYKRDIERRINISIPENYFPNNNSSQIPILSWRANAIIFFQNWINEVYQKTPYNIKEIKK